MQLKVDGAVYVLTFPSFRLVNGQPNALKLEIYRLDFRMPRGLYSDASFAQIDAERRF